MLPLLVPLARAGACCAGSTTTSPAVLGECERAMVGVGVSAEASLARWDGRRAVAGSSLSERAVAGSLVVGGRWDRKGSVTVELPARLDHRKAGELSAWGLGVGDMRALAWWDPFTERPREVGGRALPWFVGGVRLPTGRDWRASRQPLAADVTGLPGAALSAGVMVGRTLDRTPWTLGLDTEVGLGSIWQASWTASASVGRYVTSSWTASGTARHVWTVTEGGGLAERTSVGGRLTVGRPLRGRGWLGAEADVPLPGAGRSLPIGVRAGVGVAAVR